jgi:hypothetical protein
MPSMRASATLGTGEQNDPAEQLFLITRMEQAESLIKYSRIFPRKGSQNPTGCWLGALHSMLIFINGRLIGNHLHTSEQAKCD